MFRSSCFAAFARPSIYAAKRFSCGPGAERRDPTKQFYTKMLFYDPVILVIHVLLAWDYLARLTGLPFRFWLRFFSSLADIGSLVLVFSCLTRAGMRVHPKAMLLVAL